jgi:hypothetical protein
MFVTLNEAKGIAVKNKTLPSLSCTLKGQSDPQFYPGLNACISHAIDILPL